MAVYDFFVSRNSSLVNAQEYVGHPGRLFYDDTTGVVKLSDGVTPGGLSIPYTIATETTIGGIKAGPGANVSVDGTLTIDTEGLPLSIGNLQILNTTVKTVNDNDDLLLESNGTGNVVVIGDFKVYKTDGDIDSRLPEFRVNSDGQVRIVVANVDVTSGAVSVIGNSDAVFQNPVNNGVMLQLTGQPSIPSRLYNDANNSYSGWVGRRYNGTAQSPSQVLAGEEILRLVGNGYTSDGWKGAGAGRFVVAAAQNQGLNAQGGRLEFWVTPLNQPGTNGVRAAYIDAQDGLTVTGNISTSANTVMSAPAFIFNNGGVRTITGGTTCNIEFGTDSLVNLYNPSGEVTVNITNYVAGAFVRVIVSLVTARTINLGVAAPLNSSNGLTTLASNKLTNNQSVILEYACVDGTAGNTYVKSNYV